MHIAVKAGYLGHLWEALRDQKPSTPNATRVQKRVSEIVERGWAPSYMVEDLLCDMGVQQFWWTMDIHGLFEVPKRSVFERPKSSHSATMGFQETAAADLAYALIQMERLGVGVDPSPLVEALKAGILKQEVVTSSELHVLWYEDERHRMPPLSLTSEEKASFSAGDEVRLTTGYKADVVFDAQGAVALITVTAPKYRRKADVLIKAGTRVRIKASIAGASRGTGTLVDDVFGDALAKVMLDSGPVMCTGSELVVLRDQTPSPEPMRYRLPYGKWTCADGREVLFHRDYKPIWQRRPGEGVTKADPEEWVKHERQEMFYDDASAPFRSGRASKASLAKCEAILADWGVAEQQKESHHA